MTRDTFLAAIAAVGFLSRVHDLFFVDRYNGGDIRHAQVTDFHLVFVVGLFLGNIFSQVFALFFQHWFGHFLKMVDLIKQSYVFVFVFHSVISPFSIYIAWF